MAKRASSSEELKLPLFDFPIDMGEEEGDSALAGDGTPSGDEPSEALLAQKPPSAPAAPAHQPQLPGTEMPSAIAAQSSQGTAGDGRAKVEAQAPDEPDQPPSLPLFPEAEASASHAAPESAVPVAAHLAAGLADLAMQAAALGGTVFVVLLMGLELNVSKDWPPFALLALVFSFLYWVVPLAFWGRTPGMAWMGLRARSLGGEPLTFPQAGRRWLGALLTGALAGLPLLLAVGSRPSLTDRLSASRSLQRNNRPDAPGQEPQEQVATLSG